jgi:hypothetical protein
MAHGAGLKMPTFGLPGNIDDKRNLAAIGETVVVGDQALNPGGLAGFRAVVLPNLACMSDAQAHLIAEFVRGGGALIASHETSLYDAAGNKRTNLALAEVLGAEYAPIRP